MQLLSEACQYGERCTVNVLIESHGAWVSIIKMQREKMGIFPLPTKGRAEFLSAGALSRRQPTRLMTNDKRHGAFLPSDPSMNMFPRKQRWYESDHSLAQSEKSRDPM